MVEIVRTIDFSTSPELPEWPESMWPLEPSFLSSLPQELMPSREKLNALQYPWELLALLQQTMQERILDTRISPEAEFADKGLTYIEGPVWIADGAKIKPHTSIVGPVYVGEGALVGNNAMVRHALLFPGSKVGYSSEVVRSVLGKGASAFHYNFVGDSIMGEDAELSGYAKTVNDNGNRPVRSAIGGELVDTGRTSFGSIIGKKALIGAGVGILPGRKIGENAKIETGISIISKDVPDGSILRRPPSPY